MYLQKGVSENEVLRRPCPLDIRPPVKNLFARKISNCLNFDIASAHLLQLSV